MSIHIGAKPGEIAETVLLPGDPLRAKFVAENLLEDARCYNQVRGMYGYTGTYNGFPISIQGTGMGIPSISIYVHELIQEYGVKNLIRVGTCGCIQKSLDLGQVLLAIGACTDSKTNDITFNGLHYAPTANYHLLSKAYRGSRVIRRLVVLLEIYLAQIFFILMIQTVIRPGSNHGVLAVDMETSALYTLAARSQVNALSILTVSDNIITGALINSTGSSGKVHEYDESCFRR